MGRLRRCAATLIARFTLCVMLGASSGAVIVAALAAWLPHRGFESRTDFNFDEFMGETDSTIPPVVAIRYCKPGMERRTWYIGHFGEMDGPTALYWDYLGVSKRVGTFEPSSLDERDLWGGLAGAVATKDRANIPRTTETALGWPSLAFWCEIVPGWNPSSILPRGGIALSPSDGSVRLGDYRCIPYRPIWRGVLINTAFYTPFWLILLLGYPATRAWHRRRRGHCPSCAYDLRGDLAAGCPECGWRR